MANVSHLLTSDFLSGQDIPTPIVVTVKNAELKELGDEKETKVVLSFHELDKSLPCNKTRLRAMLENFGPETTGWTGQRVMIYGQKLTSGRFSGQWTVILTKAPNGPIGQPVAPPATEEAFTI